MQPLRLYLSHILTTDYQIFENINEAGLGPQEIYTSSMQFKEKRNAPNSPPISLKYFPILLTSSTRLDLPTTGTRITDWCLSSTSGYFGTDAVLSVLQRFVSGKCLSAFNDIVNHIKPS